LLAAKIILFFENQNLNLRSAQSCWRFGKDDVPWLKLMIVLFFQEQKTKIKTNEESAGRGILLLHTVGGKQNGV
jgi:hypothetical protein